MPSTWLTPPEVAEQIGIAPSKVLGWIAAGELSAVNVAATQKGRPRWRISADALEQFLAGRSVKKPTPKPRRRRQCSVVKEFV